MNALALPYFHSLLGARYSANLKSVDSILRSRAVLAAQPMLRRIRSNPVLWLTLKPRSTQSPFECVRHLAL